MSLGKIVSPGKGRLIPLSEVKDQGFASGAIGKGVAIIPEEGIIYSPISGTVHTVFETKHAYGLMDERGFEYIVHIGLDTVELGGRHFKNCVRAGDKIEPGDTIAKFNSSAIKKKGYDLTTPIVVINLKQGQEISMASRNQVMPGDEIFTIHE
ncbi:MAG: PTS glucose transporter subunit IIA [Clostridiales bacterium]|nr:PTS glucose transporter subunit IIA [Clostridiales bacterium]